MNKWFFFCLWILSIVVFFVGQFLAPSDYASLPNNPWGSLFGTSFITGVLSFVLMLIFIVVNNKQSHKTLIKKKWLKYTKILKHPTSIFTTILIILVSVVTVQAAKYAYLNYTTTTNNSNNAPSSPTPIKTLSIAEVKKEINLFRNSQGLSFINQDPETCSISNKILDSDFYKTEYKIDNYKNLCNSCFALSVAMSKDISNSSELINRWKTSDSTLNVLKDTGKNVCIVIDGNKAVLVVVKKNSAATTTNTTSADPVITCNIHADCGGGTRQMKQSECNQGTCCQIRSTWIWYPSKEQCNKDQTATKPVQQSQKPTTPTTQLNYYCYDNTNKYSYYTSSGEQCNRDNLRSSCMSLAKLSIYDPCMQKCLDTANENSGLCIWAYFGDNAAIENNPDSYQQCIEEHTLEHQQCMDACSPPYEEAYTKCF